MKDLTVMPCAQKENYFFYGVLILMSSMLGFEAKAQAYDAYLTNPYNLTTSGSTRSAIAAVDLDGDGDIDILEAAGGSFYYFENIGNSVYPNYAAPSTNPFSLAGVSNMLSIAFVDIDNDGDSDLFAGAIDGNYYFYQNTGTSLIASFAASSQNPFSLTDIGTQSTVSFVDIDNDGDKDLISSSGTSTANDHFKYFQNSGNASSPSFAAVQTDPFSLSVSSLNSAIPTPFIPVFVNIDGDGDYDILVGNASGNAGFYYFQNTGNATTPSYTAAVYNPFSLTDIIDFSSFSPAVAVVDIDNDTDYDIISGSTSTNFYTFINNQHAPTGFFAAVQSNPFGLANVGSLAASATPHFSSAFGDLDGDGDFDLLTSSDGALVYYKNTGDKANPAFTSSTDVTTLSPGASFINVFYPKLIDMDSDGDLDLLTGFSAGASLLYYNNSGTSSSPIFDTRVSYSTLLPNIGQNFDMVDLDNDGDADAFGINSSHNFTYFENTGSATAASFAAVVTNPFGLSTPVATTITPAFSDIDLDGDMDLMVSATDGHFYYYQNTGSAIAPSFAAPVDNNFSLTDIGSNSTVAFVDLDNDGDEDLMAGNSSGDFNYFKNNNEAYFTVWNGAAWSNGTATSSLNAIIEGNYTVGVNDAAANFTSRYLKIKKGNTFTVNASKQVTSGSISNQGTFTLKSGATVVNTGSAVIMDGSGYKGTYTVEQYLTGAGGATPSGRTWYVSSPLSSAKSSVFSASGANQLWSYSEAALVYSEITNDVTSLTPMAGYVAKLGANTTVSFTGGTLNSGTYTNSSLTRTGTSSLKRGYNLVANPYPSFIDWHSVTKSNLSTTIWYRTANAGGTNVFDTYNSTGSVGTNNNGSGAVSRYIAPMQTFWVQVSADGQTGSLTFTNSIRSHQSGLTLPAAIPDKQLLRLNISDGINKDETVINFDANAANDFDDYDSKKMFNNSIAQMYTFSAQEKVVINGLTDVQSNSVIPIGITTPATGQYVFHANELTGFSIDKKVYLQDVTTNTLHDLTLSSIYTFTANSGTTEGRFNLLFGEAVTSAQTINVNTFNIYQSNENVIVNLNNANFSNGTIKIFDINGKELVNQKITQNTTSIYLPESEGVYFVSVQTNDKVSIQKIVRAH
jgi:hypothetical protein